jgi:hypothetical protein
VAWHIQRTLQDLEVDPADQQAILDAVSARRDQVVTFEEPFEGRGLTVGGRS